MPDGKLFDLVPQGFPAGQLGDAFPRKILLCGFIDDKVAFVLLPVGAAGFLRFLRFQFIHDGLGLDEVQKIALRLLFLLQKRFRPFQSGAGIVHVRTGGGDGCVQFVAGLKTVFLIEGKRPRRIFEVVGGRPVHIACAFPLGFLGLNVHHAPQSVISGGVFRGFCPL